MLQWKYKYCVFNSLHASYEKHCCFGGSWGSIGSWARFHGWYAASVGMCFQRSKLRDFILKWRAISSPRAKSRRADVRRRFHIAPTGSLFACARHVVGNGAKIGKLQRHYHADIGRSPEDRRTPIQGTAPRLPHRGAARLESLCGLRGDPPAVQVPTTRARHQNRLSCWPVTSTRS